MKLPSLISIRVSRQQGLKPTLRLTQTLLMNAIGQCALRFSIDSGCIHENNYVVKCRAFIMAYSVSDLT